MRAKVCILCKEYVPIHPGNALSNHLIEDFSAWHYKHPVQTLDGKEVPPDFKRYPAIIYSKNAINTLSK